MSENDRTDLVVIDGQCDFLASGEEPTNWCWPYGGRRRGSLYVEGAGKEAVRVKTMIEDHLDAWNKIHATLDGHDRNDGSHNIHWKDRLGNIVDPYTIVTFDDVKALTYTPGFRFGVIDGKAVPAREWALYYTEQLAERGRAPLCLWPVHCQKNTWGALIYQPLAEAYDKWCDHTGGWIDFISKGGWPWTEHYSGLVADVPDSTRLETQMNTTVVNDCAGAKWVVWLGWAGSHCLPWTARDGVNFFNPTEEEVKAALAAGLPEPKNDFILKCIFIEDAMAPVPNPPFPNAPDFEQNRRDFLDEMDKRGAKISTTTEVFKLL
jgi:nicotinamidase-related amidase